MTLNAKATNNYPSTTLVKELATVIPTPAANTNYDWTDVNLQPGLYDIALYVTCTLTGTTSDLQVFALDDDGNAVGEAFYLNDTADTAGVTTYELAGGGAQEVHLLHVLAGPMAAAVPLGHRGVLLLNGFRVTLTVGTAVAAEAFKVVAVAKRL